MGIITPQQLAALRDQGYLVVPADCVPAKHLHLALTGANVPATQPRVLVRHVIDAALDGSPFSRDVLLGKGRTRLLVLVRHSAMYAAVERFGHECAHTGRQFGGRDHTTVIAAVRKVEWQLDDPSRYLGLQNMIDGIVFRAFRLAKNEQVVA